MKVSGSNEYVLWINVLKEVVNDGIIFHSRLPPCNSQNCINGKCQPLNDCECFDGFEGIKCDRKIPSFTKSLTTTKPTPETISTTSNINFDETTVAPISPDNINGTPEIYVTNLPEVSETKNNNDSEIVKSTTNSGITTTSATDVLTTFVTAAPEIVKVTPKAVKTDLISKSDVTTTISIPKIPTTSTTPTPTTPVPSAESDNTASTSVITTTTSPSIITLIPKCPFSNYCSKVAKNGICDLRCNIAECNFDNGDCIDKNADCDQNVQKDYIQSSTSNSINSDEEKVKLKIVYEINPSNFDKTKATKFLDKFSQLSNIPNIHFSKTDSGDYEIYKWTENEGKGDLINLQSFSMINGGNLEGVEINFDLDFGECKKSYSKCKFQNAKEVESYINTAPVYEVTSQLGAPVYEARIIYPEEKKSSDGIASILIWVFLGIAVAMIFSIGVLDRQTRKRNITAANSHLNEYPETSYKRRRFEAETYEGLYKLMRLQKTPESDLLEILQSIYNIRGIVDFKTERNETLLHWAIRLNLFQISSFLLDKVEDINAADISGNTYLFDSIKNSEAGFKIFQQLLLMPGIEVNTLLGPNLTPLKQCAESDSLLPFFKILCSHEKINIRSTGFLKDRKCKKQNVLHHAAGYGSIETIKFLLKLDSTKKQRKTETNLIATLDDNGRTPLVYAIESEQWEAAKLLIENMKGLEFKAGIPALIVAKNCENEEIYKLIEAKIPKETPPTPPPTKKKKTESPLDFVESFGILPSTSTMIPMNNMGYGIQQFYSPQMPHATMNQKASPLVSQQQHLPHRLQYPQQSLAASSQHASPTVASQPQQLPPSVQHPQAQVTPSTCQQSMLQYTPPTATVSQYVQVQNEHYYTVSQAQTPPSTSRQPHLSRMLSQPSIHQTSQQHQQQQHVQYPPNHYASMQSIPTSSSTTKQFVVPSTQMPHPLQQQQWQNQQNEIQYSQQNSGPSYTPQPPIYSNYQPYEPVPVQQRRSLKRSQTFAIFSTPEEYYQDISMLPQQPQQSYCYPSNYVNYHTQQPAIPLPLAQPQQQQQQFHFQQQQPPTSTAAYNQQTLNQHPQYSLIQNYETPATFTSPHLSPITDSDTSGYQTLSPDSYFNFTNDSFQ